MNAKAILILAAFLGIASQMEAPAKLPSPELPPAQEQELDIDQFNRQYYEACLAKVAGVQTRDGAEAFCLGALNVLRSTQPRRLP